MRRIVVLRPEPGASETIARARALGLEAIAIPLFEVEPIAWRSPDIDKFDAILLTSANAARQLEDGPEALRALPVYTVGTATADAARRAGFALAAVGDSGADALIASIDPALRLLHPCGVDRRATVAPQEITPLPVYRARALPAPPGLGEAQNGVALVHSPRAGRRFAELVADRGSIIIAAISPLAAEAAGQGWAAVAAAATPADDALLALAARLCNKPVTK